MDQFVVSSMVVAAISLAVIGTVVYLGYLLYRKIRYWLNFAPKLSEHQWNWVFLRWIASLATAGVLFSWAFQLDGQYVYCFGWGMAAAVLSGITYAQYRAIQAHPLESERLKELQQRLEHSRRFQADDDDSWLPLQNE
jgi:hypothetical protein